MPNPGSGKESIEQIELHLAEPSMGRDDPLWDTCIDLLRGAPDILSHLLSKLIARSQRDVLIEAKVVLTFDPVCQHTDFIDVDFTRRKYFKLSCGQITLSPFDVVHKRLLRTRKRQRVIPPIGQGLSIRSAENELLAVISATDEILGTKTGVDVDRGFPPTEIEIESTVTRQAHTNSRRSLPIPISIAFGSPSSIIDLRDAGCIPRESTNEKSRALCLPETRPLSRNVLNDPYSKKAPAFGEPCPRFVVMLITPPMASAPHSVL